MSPVRSTERRRGFTLIEMLAVMLIVALVSLLAVAMAPGTGRAQLEAVGLRIGALLRRERMRAMLTGRDRWVTLDPGHRRLVAEGGDAVAIPRDVVLDVIAADQSSTAGLAAVSFHPDGGSSGGILRLSRDRGSVEIHVNWYMGNVVVGVP